MCDFCEGKEIRKIWNVNNIQSTAHIEQEKFLVIRDGDKKYGYDLNYCPECGRKLSYEQVIRFYVTNITKDEVICLDIMKDYPDYQNNPLHALICDKRIESSDVVEKQVGFIIPENKVNDIKENGYCDLVCTASYEL